MRSFASLRRRADFNRLRQRGRRVTSAGFTILHGAGYASDARSLAGISVSKAVGTAVVRNRLRRRFSAILDEGLKERPDLRLLLIARPEAARMPFAALRSAVLQALK